MNIVIVGHVDHGKSTLIGRLLYDTGSIPESLVDDIKAISAELGKEMEFAYLLDSLEEEREQNITIDTTQTFFSSKKRDYVIIDAPGHREFLKNMITGASMAEAAVLIVDANKGMEEQTKRHAYIVKLLGISNLVVVLNKLDESGYQKQPFDDTTKGVKEFLDKLGASAAHFIPISAKEGDNIASRSKKIPWYKGPSLVEALDSFSPKATQSKGDLRFPIQDVYKIGDEEIFVGRIESGVMHVGDEVTFLPSAYKEKIRAIKVWQQEKVNAVAGECIGVTFEGNSKLSRGEIACAGTLPKVSKEIEATLFWMSQIPVSLNDEITIKCATQEIPCSLSRIKVKIDSSSLEEIESDATKLEETQVGEVIIHTKSPIVTEPFLKVEHLGRFVLTRDGDIVAGGILKT